MCCSIRALNKYGLCLQQGASKYLYVSSLVSSADLFRTVFDMDIIYNVVSAWCLFVLEIKFSNVEL